MVANKTDTPNPIVILYFFSGLPKLSSSSVLDNLTSSCGQKPGNKKKQYRVVGGQLARKHTWPWQVIQQQCRLYYFSLSFAVVLASDKKCIF